MWQVSEAKCYQESHHVFWSCFRNLHMCLHTRTRTLQEHVLHTSKLPRLGGRKCNVHGMVLRDHGEVDGGGTSLIS